MSLPLAVTVGPSAYWYLTRATGITALILLTLTMLLGVVNVERLSTERTPRFVIDQIHRTASLLAITFLCVHIITASLDSFVSISLLDAVVPFIGTYRPLWLGLGVVAFDLMLAVAITSLIRARLGYRAWRLVHWLAYASWPVALLHGLGTGSDIKSDWMLAIAGTCLAAVLLAVLIRLASGWSDKTRVRAAAGAVAVGFTIGAVLWLPSGPLGSHWSRRAGTPSPAVAPAPPPAR